VSWSSSFKFIQFPSPISNPWSICALQSDIHVPSSPISSRSSLRWASFRVHGSKNASNKGLPPLLLHWFSSDAPSSPRSLVLWVLSRCLLTKNVQPVLPLANLCRQFLAIGLGDQIGLEAIPSNKGEIRMVLSLESRRVPDAHAMHCPPLPIAFRSSAAFCTTSILRDAM
jgi:hypothetical protein